jgi:predicted ATPase
LSVHTQPEVCFQQALDVARRQHAKSWELRAALSLTRSWLSQGKHAEARAVIEPLVVVFTQGLETPDVAAARAIMESIGRGL